ncbi:MAG: hypothetical protein HZC14_00390 [Candidatus Niyogibacteria bacterium]|nr:hypothetical protein [Candidatus Niyogibacteria bacterium]
MKFLRKYTSYFILNLSMIIPAKYALAAPLANPLQINSISELVNKVANIVMAIGIPVAAVFIIYAGFLFVTAQGSEEQIKKAKTTLYWTIIGTALLVGAKVIATALETTIKNL